MSTPVRLVAAACAALASGCVMTHHCTVPQPVVEAATGTGKLPLAVAVRIEPLTTPTERFEQRDPYHRWAVDPLPPSRALFDRLAASMFEPAVPGPGTQPGAAPDAVLDVELQGVRFAWTPIGFGPYTATAAYRVTLRAADGAVVTAFDLAGEGARGTVWKPATHCAGIGDAVALAMQDAGAKLVARLGTDPAVTAWLAARGIAAPTLAVRPAAAYPDPDPAAGQPGQAAGPEYEAYTPPGMAMAAVAAPPPAAPAAARPVSAPPPGALQAPRSMQLRVGVGTFQGDSSAGRLEAPRTGLGFTLLGVEVRPRPAIGVTLELGSVGREYSSRTLQTQNLFFVPDGIFLSTTTFGLGVRGILPGGPVEPWIGATALLARTELSGSYSVFGFSGSGDPQETAWSAGLDLGAGLLFYPGRRFQLGIEVRRVLSRASFDVFGRDVSIGGWATTVTFGGAMP